MTAAIDRGYWRDVVGAEYDSLPELSLTLAQTQRLWNLDAETGRWVLESFVDSGYLVPSRATGGTGGPIVPVQRVAGQA